MKRSAAACLIALAALSGCATDEAADPDTVALVRIAVPASVPMDESVTAQLAVTDDGCLQLVGARQSSVWWSTTLDVAVRRERLVVDGVDRGPIGPDGITVRLSGADYPVSPVGLDVSGPFHVLCNQLAPFTAGAVEVLR